MVSSNLEYYVQKQAKLLSFISKKIKNKKNYPVTGLGSLRIVRC
jgi:hypothetical protein